MPNNFEVGDIVYQKTSYGMIKSKIVKIVNNNYVIIDKGFGEQKVRVDQLIKDQDDEMSAKEKEILSKLQEEFSRGI